MRVSLNDLHWQDRPSVVKCQECQTREGSVFLCGWHENVVAASARVELFALVRAACPSSAVDTVALTAEVERIARKERDL